MPLEIERKFLVNGDFRNAATTSVNIIQGYLSSEKGKTIRVRLTDNEAYLTIKGKAEESHFTRFEWEKEIRIDEARDLLRLCTGALIDKTRYIVPVGSHIFEVDVFHSENEGLIVAEVELSSEDEDFIKPDWLGKEVTGDKKYYNSRLVRNPFKNW